jgi:hypothetical protein
MQDKPAERAQINLQITKEEKKKSDQFTQQHHILTGIIIINFHQVTYNMHKALFG